MNEKEGALNPHFKCKMCGKCCQFGYFEKPNGELYIKYGIGLEKDEIRKFKGKVKRVHFFGRTAYFLKERKDGYCIFLNNNNRCSVNEIKPKCCKNYTCQNPFPDTEKSLRKIGMTLDEYLNMKKHIA